MNITKILIGLLLIVIAKVIFMILVIPAVITALIFYIYNSTYSNIGTYLKNIAISIDQLGNVVCKVLFDLTLITSNANDKFGNVDETVSSVLGKNERSKTLSILGYIIVSILNMIDLNHSEKAIEDNEVQRTIK
tara:strand:+ start:7376 stop:7777 length:402 start_codon:yes stop_codon:yes gene_type:complete